jgi:16S rRNA (adenine1518-N6/adenine1519-N6)-dimethyltransferase
MKLSEMRQTLAAHGVQLTKSLGQNFLHDGNQLRRIAAAARLAPGDRVLEIGPGLGPLTELLLEQAGEVFAIEKDRRLLELLRARLGAHPRLRLLEGDGLEFVRGGGQDWTGWKLVANLPYCIASPVLVELARAPACPELVVVTLQLEVAQRLTAGPGSRDYGVLTLAVQARYQPEGLFKIPASCFYPAPEIDSACVVLRRRAELLLEPALHPVFDRIVRRSFSQRRKMMHKLLKEDWPAVAVDAALSRLGIPHEARAETISLAQYAALTRALRS